MDDFNPDRQNAQTRNRQLVASLLELQLKTSRLGQQLQAEVILHQNKERELRLRDCELGRLHDENRNLGRLLEQTRSELAALTSSLSWRMTHPFRRLKNLSPRNMIRRAREVRLIESCGLFSAEWYLDQYRDVRDQGVNPSVHYLRNGWREGRNPHPLFDTSWYLERCPDVAAVGMNPLVHFLLFGMSEGRVPHAKFEGWQWSESHCESLRHYFMRKTAGAVNLASYDAGAPELSIVILNFNKAFLTLQCLASVWDHTEGCKYEIVVVDNGSTHEDVAILKAIEGPFRLLCLDCNRFFGEGNNIGAEVARGRFLAFLNNDVVVTAGWLAPLLRAFREHPDCGAAGPKFVYPDGRLQEAGAFIRADGWSQQRGKRGNPDDPEFTRGMRVDYVSAATILVKKQIFERAQGFDFRWEPAYYEDVDLCFKIACLNLHTYYVPESTVVHYENATTADPKQGMRLYDAVDINRGKFLDRWHRYLVDRNPRAAQQCVQLPPEKRLVARNSGNLRIALFTPYSIIPGGGERYLFTVAASLLNEHEVWLVTAERYSRIRIDAVARIFDLDVSHLHLVPLKDLNESTAIDLWVAMGNNIVPPIAGYGKHNVFVLQFPFPVPPETIRATCCFWNGYERVIVYSRYVASHVTRAAQRSGLPPRPIEIIPPPVDSRPEPAVAGKDRYSIISVGRFFTGWHCKRQDLLIRAFRRVVSEHPSLPLELHLVGSLHPEPENREYFHMCEELASGLPIHFHLDASPDMLTSLYRSSSIYWHATGMEVDLEANPEKAEHFGISVVEGMANGCIPVVFGRGGPGEIVQDGISGLHFQNADGLVAATLRVLIQYHEAWVSQMRLAAVIRSGDFGKAVFCDSWQRIVSALR